MIIDEEEHLAHYGVQRRSGRYPWGSGVSEDTHNRNLLGHIATMRKEGFKDVEIAEGLGISTTQLRAKNTIARNQQLQANITQAQRLRDKGMSNVAIGEKMGKNESSVRALLAPGAKDNADILLQTAKMLKDEVDTKKMIDIGSGVETHLNVSKEKLGAAVAILEEQGYMKHTFKEPQPGTKHKTEFKVLTVPGVTQREAWDNRYSLQQPGRWSDDGGRNYKKIHPPVAIAPKRVAVRYKEDGGADADGVIYVRPGVKDITLGEARYAQVRVQVGKGHYLKGMAMYKDDLPDGVDLMFNTNKPKKDMDGDDLKAMKKLEKDPDLPFGSVIRRQIGTGLDGPTPKVTSVMNLVNEEGQWGEWSRNLSAQFLSKQSPALAKTQLDITYQRRKTEFDDINGLTNPKVKKVLLEKFAEGTDAAAVHLKAASLPRSNWHAILPINTLPESQIYAPQYNNGDRVSLIRYPHGGTFEIPELTVNNRHPEARRLLGDNPVDAVGIHFKVAERLSGADFDGDTVLVIPNDSGKVKSTAALEGLKNFEPRTTYKAYDGMPEMTPKRKQQEMGNVSNLITDMTLKGASRQEVARAVRHSMVVIDAEKHHLNYKQSALDNGIAQLKKDYQGGPRAGASTLISKKKSEDHVDQRKLRPARLGGGVDPDTGRRVYIDTGATRRGKDGELIRKKEFVKKLDVIDDAHTLTSGTRMEGIYADHSNRLKGLANTARLTAFKTPPLKYSPSAKRAYVAEVASLDAKLALALKNRPKERMAILLANAEVRAMRDANPNLDGDSLKKVKYQALTNARIRTGAAKYDIIIEQKEWDAIQAGAISDNKLGEILKKADIDIVRTLATPRASQLMTSAKSQRAQQLLSLGYTRAEVAADLGVSLTTLDTSINGE